MLSEALAVAEPLVAWLVRSGIGHGAFAAALKPVFLEQAQAELQRTGRKSTDTAASLLSGLHREDVRALRAAADDGGVDADTIRIRVAGSSTDLATIRLIGTITDFVDAGHFTVRSVPVDATAIDPNNACPGVTLGNDVRVDVFAVPQEGTEGDAVIARVVRIDGSLGADQHRPNGNAWGRYKERNVK